MSAVLKENVILGHLVPAGTGFRIHQDAEVRIRPEALQELQAERERIMAARRDLLSKSEAAGDGRRPSILDVTPES